VDLINDQQTNLWNNHMWAGTHAQMWWYADGGVGICVDMDKGLSHSHHMSATQC